jgi:hypothetical protein
MINRKDITNTLPTGILEDGVFTPDAAGLAVRMSGFYTLGELLDIVEDLKHVDAVYQEKQYRASIMRGVQAEQERKLGEAAQAAYDTWSRGHGATEAANRWAEAYQVDVVALLDRLGVLIRSSHLDRQLVRTDN